jgi:hypothetical protein
VATFPKLASRFSSQVLVNWVRAGCLVYSFRSWRFQN